MTISAFLHGLSPIFFLINMLGALQWRESFDQETKKYTVWIKYASLQTMYAVCAVGLKLTLVAQLALKSFMAFGSIEDDQKLNALSYICNIFGPMLVPVLIVMQRHRVKKILEFWYEFEQNILSISLSQAPLELGIYRSSLSLACIAVICCVGFCTVGPILQGEMPALVDLLQAIGAVYAVVIYSSYYLSCKAAEAASTRILNEFRCLTEHNESGKYRGRLDEVCLMYRKVWLQLTNIMQFAGSSISLALAYQILMSLVLVLFIGFSLLNSLAVVQLDSLIIMCCGLLMAWFEIGAVCTAGHKLHRKVKSDFMESIQLVKSMRASKTIIQTTNTFLLHLVEILTPIHLDGYMKLDRVLLSTLLSVYLTNLVVLYQLKIGSSALTSISEIQNVKHSLFS